ncbi:MAG: bifunctional phosphopantothenoylcysteine decarboxylase/phosphopantothenate--cysteine ligase CoaBC [Desulfovibrio sp.]|nr:bifunctional phosphopantothenoylcysteine decarboxylase/phosphopantothenate--cysteine ligase CoaBC [Desulfovibrio sp.]
MLPSHLKFPIHHGSRVQLGVTGSIAAYKALELLRIFHELELVVGVTLTKAATQFVTPLSFEALGAEHVYANMWGGADSAFGHLEPAQEARCLVIAPATANIMAKLAHGIADEILSTQALAFSGPVLLAPAMNPRLWDAKATQSNVDTLRSHDLTVLEPASGMMACGEIGKGRLASLPDITAHVLRLLTAQDMAGTKVLVSLGPTREYFDPARYWSNPSTGIMGAALAIAAWLRGANVTVVHGPVNLWFPDSIRLIPVQTAREMFSACVDLWSSQDIALMTAAVSDFSPVYQGNEKFKKSSLKQNNFQIDFTANPDILRTLGESKTVHQKLLGFCAETSDLASYAAQKLKDKNCDVMVANSIVSSGSGFGSHTNQVFVVDSFGRSEQWPTLSKCEVAWRLLEWMTHLLV